VGDFVGDSDKGVIVGALVGLDVVPVGLSDGAIVQFGGIGDFDGAEVGKVGEFVGDLEGLCVGTPVGPMVEIEGECVGLIV
jgi:hypothetical protein